MDLSALTDDQLIELARLVIDEGLRRNPATATATQDMMITAAERARIANLATDLEIRAARARERERIATAAASAVRAADAQARQEQRLAQARDLLARAAAWVEREPRDVTIVRLPGRVLVNEGSDRYARSHLADWQGGALRTPRSLVARKPALAALCVEVADTLKIDCIRGVDYYVS